MYCEMWLLFLYELMSAVWASGWLLMNWRRQPREGTSSAFRLDRHRHQQSALKRRVRRAYHRWRNAVSLRVFVRLALGGARWIPIDEERLASHSPLYRFLAPHVFGRLGGAHGANGLASVRSSSFASCSTALGSEVVSERAQSG
jgi:hypothetical protein